MNDSWIFRHTRIYNISSSASENSMPITSLGDTRQSISSGQISGLACFVDKGYIRREDAWPVAGYEW